MPTTIEEAEHQSLMKQAGMVEITPRRFLTTLYPKDEVIPITHSGTGGARGTYRRCKRANVIEYIKDKTDAYIYPARFFNEVPRTELLQDLLAFVVDLDDVETQGLRKIIEAIEQNPNISPSHITRTGTGVHLWYCLQSPPEIRKLWRRGLNNISSAIYDYWEDVEGCNVDMHCRSIPHGFRVPGSKTKNDERTTTVWQVSQDRESIPLQTIQEAFNVYPTYPPHENESGETEEEGQVIDFFNFEQLKEEREYAIAAEEKRKAERAARRKERGEQDPQEQKKKTRRKAHRHPNLYYNTISGMRTRCKPGHRYLSMFVAAATAYDCGIPKKELQTDLEEFVDLWSGSSDPIRRSEIDKAMLGYSEKWVRLKKETREEMLGWKYPPGPNRRKNPWTRQKNMKWVIEERAEKAEFAVYKAHKRNPEGSVTEIAKAANVSYNTAKKYLKQMRGWAKLKDKPTA